VILNIQAQLPQAGCSAQHWYKPPPACHCLSSLCLQHLCCLQEFSGPLRRLYSGA